MEKQNYINKLITALEIDGHIVKKPIKITEVQYEFYQGLYSEKLNVQDYNYQHYLDEFLVNNEMPKLTNEEKETCDKPITKSEISKSIKNLSSCKTPRSDRLAVDFYKFFWCDIKNLLTQSIIYVIAKGELSIEQKRGIRLLLQKGKNMFCFLKLVTNKPTQL